MIFNESNDPVSVQRLGIALEPEMDYEKRPDGGGGCEDPRITFIEPLKIYVMTYCAFGPGGPRIAMAISEDLFHWQRLGLINYHPFGNIDFNGVNNKDACLFPVDVFSPHGHLSIAMLHRPLFPGTSPEEMAGKEIGNKDNRDKEEIWISYCNLTYQTAKEYQDNQTGLSTFPHNGKANLYISCVDKVAARMDIAGILKGFSANSRYERNKPLYWMDCGNSKDTGQVILSTIEAIKQPESEQYRTVAKLPMVTDEFRGLLEASEIDDDTPSCSLAEALTKQDLFINSTLANLGASLLWSLFREGMLFNRGFFLNLKEFSGTQPLKVG